MTRLFAPSLGFMGGGRFPGERRNWRPFVAQVVGGIIAAGVLYDCQR